MGTTIRVLVDQQSRLEAVARPDQLDERWLIPIRDLGNIVDVHRVEDRIFLACEVEAVEISGHPVVFEDDRKARTRRRPFNGRGYADGNHRFGNQFNRH
ncbi:MAG: hypothetical protein ABS86_04090 [Sphingobium sp. SCN 64-10]|nr:MAG: hypothetical protein ABS86_04090 [Sphingobium sp. SCN 64-10]